MLRKLEEEVIGLASLIVPYQPANYNPCVTCCDMLPLLHVYLMGFNFQCCFVIQIFSTNVVCLLIINFPRREQFLFLIKLISSGGADNSSRDELCSFFLLSSNKVKERAKRGLNCPNKHGTI